MNLDQCIFVQTGSEPRQIAFGEVLQIFVNLVGRIFFPHLFWQQSPPVGNLRDAEWVQRCGNSLDVCGLFLVCNLSF